MQTLGRDFAASLVVFLVALPLCLGIAIASGVPPASGIVSGIVGGIIVGALAGSPLQVSGPAAGLVISVVIIVDGYGVPALGPAVMFAGALQVIAAAFKSGRWFRAVSPALITGMLAGIGVLIAASQTHVMMGVPVPGGGLNDIIGIPATLAQSITGPAAWIGIGTIVLLVLWDRFRPERLKIVPGPLLAVGVATVCTAVFELDIAKVSLPPSLGSALMIPSLETFSLFTDVNYIGAAAALGLIASAQGLLCANATDALHSGPSTDYNRELLALGVGNVVAGGLGALPVTGVIVRSVTNIDAGATTRASAIIHGFLLVILVSAAPWLLGYIPIATLAGTLVFIGAKLAAPSKFMALYRAGHGEAWVFLVTVAAIVWMGLLTGILIGLALASAKLLYTFSHLEVDVEKKDERYDIDVHGAATFVGLPKLAEALEAIPESAEVHVHLGGLAYVDHACAELLQRQQTRRETAGGVMVTEWDELHRLSSKRPLIRRGTDSERPRAEATT